MPNSLEAHVEAKKRQPQQILLGLMIGMCLSSSAAAAMLGTYQFTSGAATVSGPAIGLTFGTFARGSGVSTQTGSNDHRSGGFDAASISAAIAGNDYVSFTISAGTGYRYTLTQFGYDYARDAGGSPSAQLQSSRTGFSSSGFLGTLNTGANQTLALSGFTNLTSATEFRLYAFRSPNPKKTHVFDNILLQGDTQALASLSTSILTSPVTRVMKNTTGVRYSVGITNDALPAGTTATQGLDYSLNLSGATGLTLSSPSSGAGLAGGSSVTRYVNVDTGTTGLKSGSLTVTGSNAWRANGTVGSTQVNTTLSPVAVLDNRTVSASVDLGNVLVGANSDIKGATLSSTTGDDNAATRITVNANGASAGGMTVGAGATTTFNGGGQTDTRQVSGVFASSGIKTGAVSLSRTGENLPGEVDNAVNVNYTAHVYDPASISATPGPILNAGSGLQLSNAPATPGGLRANATVTKIDITHGLNGSWSLSGVGSSETMAPGQTCSGTIGVNTTGLLNGLNVTGSVSIQITNSLPGGLAGAKTGDVGTYFWNLSTTVTGNSGNQSANIAASGSYSNLSGASDRKLSSVATILAGSNADGAATTVSLNWNDPTNYLLYPQGMVTSQPMGLISDVANLSGTDGDVFVLQMSYAADQIAATLGMSDEQAARAGLISLGTLSGSIWQNAILANHGINTGQIGILSSWESAGSPMKLGSWGVDTEHNAVWAVLDHNSSFVVGVLPEPTAFALFSLLLVAECVVSHRRYRRR